VVLPALAERQQLAVWEQEDGRLPERRVARFAPCEDWDAFAHPASCLARKEHQQSNCHYTQLTGTHLHITTVETGGAVDLFAPDGTFYEDPSDWTGFVIDQIEWISNKAGFTYTLQLPSGMGSLCKNAVTSANKPYHSSTWASQYTCGEQDVDENRTHMYWGMYYYTKGRAEKNLMTVPFINNVGLDLGVSAQPPSTKFETIVSALETPFRPFTAGMWAAIIGTFVVGAIFMWIIEVRRLIFRRHCRHFCRHF
jgi:hypothetical protein